MMLFFNASNPFDPFLHIFFTFRRAEFARF